MYPGCVWNMPSDNKTLYLSFDDGPHPTITPFVLNELKKYNAKATFFCIGDNVKKYPEVYKQLLTGGHAVGNHTMHHINGWKKTDDAYINDIKEASHYISSTLFRPPYGRIKKSQIKQLTTDNYKLSIIMWNILAGDWDAQLQPEKCYLRIQKKISNGDIVVFHDSEKAWDRMSYALPKLLKDFSDKGFTFSTIK